MTTPTPTTSLRYSMGITAFDERRYKDAVDHFEAVLDDAPNDLNVREYLARAHFHRAALAPAEREARAVLDADPTNEYMLLLLARTLERQSRADEGAALRRRLATLSGDDRHLAAHTPAA